MRRTVSATSLIMKGEGESLPMSYNDFLRLRNVMKLSEKVLCDYSIAEKFTSSEDVQIRERVIGWIKKVFKKLYEFKINPMQHFHTFPIQ